MPDPDTGGGSGQVEVGLFGVRKKFGDYVAVDGIDLEVKRGEFFSLLGPSGCGKTTTLRMIAGFEEPDEGKLVLSGADIAGTPPNKRNVNTVFQSYALFPHLTIADNVAFGLRRKGIGKRDAQRQVHRYLDLVQLPGYEKRRPGQLSGGQQQRVALARALINEPAVLLLDEPLGALDMKLRKQMQLELVRIQREVGITFIYVTHDQEEALIMSDRIAVMSAGHVEQIGAPEEIYERPATRFVAGFIGTSNIIDTTVSSTSGDHLVLESAPHDKLMVRAAAASVVASGDAICLTVRPEKIRLAGLDAPVPDGFCVLTGRVEDVVYQGVSTQYVVRTREGATLVAFRQNSETVTDVGTPGDDVRLLWNADHNVILNDGPARRPEPAVPVP
ncbi:MAG: ABC transporter ATP-binding protein [Actinomycetota bacterium]